MRVRLYLHDSLSIGTHETGWPIGAEHNRTHGQHPLDRRLSGSPFAAPVSWCGLMCYSLYLVHWPVCKGLSHALYAAGVDTPRLTVLVTMPACLAASIAAAWPFHVLVERRFLNPPSAAVSPSAPVAAPA